jgi:hypothetical protein
MALMDAVAKLDSREEYLEGDVSTEIDARLAYFESIRESIAKVVGGDRAQGSLHTRLEQVPAIGNHPAVLFRDDPQTRAVVERAAAIRELNGRTFDGLQNALLAKRPDITGLKDDYAHLRDEIVLLAGTGQLPARNVGAIGYLLYTEHLLAVELAGTLLLVATIGAIAIAQRKGEAA